MNGNSKNPIYQIFVKISLLAATIFLLVWVYRQTFSNGLNLSIIIGAILLVFPVVFLGRRALDANPTLQRMTWVTIFVHYALIVLFGAAIIQAITTHTEWMGWVLPVPEMIGYILVILTSAFTILTVINLALKGLGAPFAIALSQKLTMDWLYAWTRNPMVLGTLATLLSLGLWYRSAWFVVWTLVLTTPAWLFFVKVYEERELEIRFGDSYLEYKARTPMLFPRRPKRG